MTTKTLEQIVAEMREAIESQVSSTGDYYEGAGIHPDLVDDWADELKAIAQQEPIGKVVVSDPYDERDGVWISWNRIPKPGDPLYTTPHPQVPEDALRAVRKWLNEGPTNYPPRDDIAMLCAAMIAAAQ